MKATSERAMVSECVSGPTLPQCFSGVPQLACIGRVCGIHNERKRTTNDPETVSGSRIGSVYLASIGRVRVASGCPLRSLADACEWARLFG